MTNNTHIITYSGKDYKINTLNSELRNFIQTTNKKYVFLYNEKTELAPLTDSNLTELIAKYENLHEHTHIHYLVGKTQPQKTLDYGSIKFVFGYINEQKFVYEFLTREAILKTGYFDVRFNDNCRVGDLVYRLSSKNLYPRQDVDKLPFVFDIENDSSEVYAKHVFNELSCGWFQYKYKNFPQIKEQESFDNIINSIKDYKKTHEQL